MLRCTDLKEGEGVGLFQSSTSTAWKPSPNPPNWMKMQRYSRNAPGTVCFHYFYVSCGINTTCPNCGHICVRKVFDATVWTNSLAMQLSSECLSVGEFATFLSHVLKEHSALSAGEEGMRENEIIGSGGHTSAQPLWTRTSHRTLLCLRRQGHQPTEIGVWSPRPTLWMKETTPASCPWPSHMVCMFVNVHTHKIKK